MSTILVKHYLYMNESAIAKYSPDQSFDKEKYLTILKEEGLSAALTTIQKDLWELETECFEGPSGYQPELYELMRKYRAFSLELWDRRFDQK